MPKLVWLIYLSQDFTFMLVKKQLRLWLLGILSALSINSYACDLCNIYVGIRPDDYQSSFGIVHRFRSFDSDFLATIPGASLEKHGEEFSLEDYSLQEEFNSYDFWFKYFLTPRLQLNASITFSDNYMGRNDSMTQSIAGPGDLILMAKYQIYNSKLCEDTSEWTKRLTAGGGIKLPTGTYNKTYMYYPIESNTKGVYYSDPENHLDPHMQAGSGSVDFILFLEGVLMRNNWGVSTNMSYKINSRNKNNFKFANRFNLNPSIFFIKDLNKVKIMPTIGAAYESSNRDQWNGDFYRHSGGETLFGNASLTAFYDKISIGMTYFNPIYQNLNDNQIQNKMRLITELNYYF